MVNGRNLYPTYVEWPDDDLAKFLGEVAQVQTDSEAVAILRYRLRAELDHRRAFDAEQRGQG